MTDQLILQLIIAITTYCEGINIHDSHNKSCFKRIWLCGHNVTDSIAIVTETHNCITKDVKGILKKDGTILEGKSEQKETK